MDEVTAIQAARLTGLSERTIRRRIASGSLPARRIARNRFAINLRDLPVTGHDDALAAQVEALERRVRTLEEEQRALLRRLKEREEREEREECEGAGSQGETDSAAQVAQELLARLAREAARLAPLLGASDAPDRVGEDCVEPHLSGGAQYGSFPVSKERPAEEA